MTQVGNEETVGGPRIERVSSKIAALERRAEYLERQLDEGRGSRSGQEFARAELGAIKAAIQALKFHRAEVEGLDTVVLALQDLVDTGRALHMPDYMGGEGEAELGRFSASLTRAATVLEEWS